MRNFKIFSFSTQISCLSKLCEKMFGFSKIGYFVVFMVLIVATFVGVGEAAATGHVAHHNEQGGQNGGEPGELKFFRLKKVFFNKIIYRISFKSTPGGVIRRHAVHFLVRESGK